MDNPIDAVKALVTRLENVRASKAALLREEQTTLRELDDIRALLTPTRPPRARGSRALLTPDGFVPGAQPDRIMDVIRAAGREGATAYEIRKAAQISQTSLPAQLTRLRHRGLIARREGTHLWAAVTPPDGGYATPADGPVS